MANNLTNIVLEMDSGDGFYAFNNDFGYIVDQQNPSIRDNRELRELRDNLLHKYMPPKTPKTKDESSLYSDVYSNHKVLRRPGEY